MPGVLYVVATPIGHLGDCSPRALEVLGQSDRVACEDTRVSLKLLNHWGLKRPLVSYREANEATLAVELADQVAAGSQVALICDAGTPCISDPGFRLVRECHRRGLRVVPIPGPNAALAALMASGLPTDSFLFTGFVPPKSAARKNFWQAHQHLEATLVCYESCHRILPSLESLEAVMGPQRVVCVGRELTKQHETILTGPLASVRGRLESGSQKGEFVVCIAKEGFSL